MAKIIPPGAEFRVVREKPNLPFRQQPGPWHLERDEFHSVCGELLSEDPIHHWERSSLGEVRARAICPRCLGACKAIDN